MRRGQAELLAPAGSFDSLKAAVAAGADAVYIGGSRFGARAYADNLDEEKMLEAIDYAHIHGVSLYMTVNTLMKEQELEELFAYLNPYYERGLDGVIVQDLGAVSYIRRHFPLLPVHGSTQMTITGAYGARILADLGVTRVVTAREMSLEEIERIHREIPGMEIESFVHGALCYCYSGQCLLSSLIGGRSGNRGRCAQPCRLPYEENPGKKGKDSYLLSMKDLCTLDLIPDLLEAGIYSLKIEGRMKSPKYTAGVVRTYRKYVDLYLEQGRENYRVDPADRRELLDLFDRGGFTKGYYKQHNGPDMIARKEKPKFRQANEELFEELDRLYVNGEKKEPIHGELTVTEGEEAVLKLWMAGSEEKAVLAKGSVAEAAQSRPVSKEQLKKQMRKTGGTPFEFESLNIVMSEAVFLPLKEVNQLRRAGLELLEKSILDGYGRQEGEKERRGLKEEESVCRPKQTAPKLSVLLSSWEGLPVVLKTEAVREVILEADEEEPEKWKEAAKQCHLHGKTCVLAMPVIFRTRAEKYWDENMDKLSEAGFDGILARSLEELGYLKSRGVSLPAYGDHNLYVFNSEARDMLFKLGCRRITLPLELNRHELGGLGGEGSELIGYGLLPAMVSAQCVTKTLKGCSHTPRWLELTDRTGKKLPVRNHCRYCYNIIYNPTPLSLLDQWEEIKRIGPEMVRLSFTRESKEETEQILSAWTETVLGRGSREKQGEGFTRGHFKRGVE